MRKSDIKKLWNTYAEAARAIGITKGAITNWPEELSPGQQAKVVFAALRDGKQIPAHWLKKEEKSE